MNKTIWFDYTNPPHVNTLLPFYNYFNAKDYHSFSTAKEFVETVNLLKKNEIDTLVYGAHAGKLKILKVYSLLSRISKMYFSLPKFDFSFTMGFEAPIISYLRGKPSLMIEDNDITKTMVYGKFITYVLCPWIIDGDKLKGIDKNKLIKFEGFKEDLYISQYKPNQSFLDEIPFDNYVVVRPENLFASYVPKNVKTIVPELIKQLINKNINIVYLPRYQHDRDYIQKNDKIFIPSQPLNGLDVCYFADAVLTGAGTFAREAALLGTPAVSFFAGKILLAVDQELIRQNKMYHSRDVKNILNYLENKKKNECDFNRSIHIFNDVISKIEKLI